MYHYITLWDIKIYMTWVGIIVFLLTFLLSLRMYGKKHTLPIHQFMTNVPFYLIWIYIFSSYTRYLLGNYTIIPLNLQQLLLYFSPTWYQFHLVGILIGALAIGLHTILNTTSLDKKNKWVDAFIHSVCLACIPLWIFLLLGDNFIGRSTETWLFVTAMRSDSNLAIYGKVLPLGLFLSLRWLVCHMIMNMYTYKTKKTFAYAGIALFCLWLCAITLFQQYPRHIVTSIQWITFDIKQYLLLIISVYFIYKHVSTRSHNLEEAPEVTAF